MPFYIDLKVVTCLSICIICECSNFTSYRDLYVRGPRFEILLERESVEHCEGFAVPGRLGNAAVWGSHSYTFALNRNICNYFVTYARQI